MEKASYSTRGLLRDCENRWIFCSSSQDRYGLFINFDREVEETRSQLNISPLTLLTRIGGIIGVGKEFLWIIITLATYLISIYSNICKYSFR